MEGNNEQIPANGITRLRSLVASAVLLAAAQVVAWCVWFALVAFFRSMQLDDAVSWAWAREFALIATLVCDGIVLGALACRWALLELGFDA